MLNDYKYAIRTTKQAGNYNMITIYLILHIRKTYKHSTDIADAIEKQEPFNFNPSAPRLKISSTVETDTTSPLADAIEKQEPFNFNPSALRLKILSSVETPELTPQDKLEIQCENDQYNIEYEAELQLNDK